MDEIELRIRAAKPKGAWRGMPLTDRAEHELATLLANGAEPKPKHKGSFRPAIALLIGAAAAVVIAFVAIGLNMRPMFAATPPLLIFSPDHQSEQEVLENAIIALNRLPGAEPTTTQEIRVHQWELGPTIEVKNAGIITPEYVVSTRSLDGSRDRIVTAGQSIDGDGRAFIGEGITAPGTLLRTEHESFDQQSSSYAPATMSVVMPPADVGGARRYLENFAGIDAGSDAASYLSAIADVMMLWQLDPRQEAAFLGVLLSLPDLEVAGAVDDRIGRTGIALSATRADGYRMLLVLSNQTGQVISFETVYTGSGPFTLKANSVVAYRAWER